MADPAVKTKQKEGMKEYYLVNEKKERKNE